MGVCKASLTPFMLINVISYPAPATVLVPLLSAGHKHCCVHQKASESGVPVALRQKFSSYHGLLQISHPY